VSGRLWFASDHFPFAFCPSLPLVSRRAKFNCYLNARKSGSSRDSTLAATSISGSGILYDLRSRRAHRIAWAIVWAAENHFRAVNDNHDIANRRIPITPDLDFRWSVFAGHRNIFLCSRAVSIFPSPSAPQFYCFSPGGACSGKDSVCVAGVAPPKP